MGGGQGQGAVPGGAPGRAPGARERRPPGEPSRAGHRRHPTALLALTSRGGDASASKESLLFARTAEDGNPHGDTEGAEVLLPHPAHLQSPRHNLSRSSVSARLALGLRGVAPSSVSAHEAGGDKDKVPSVLCPHCRVPGDQLGEPCPHLQAGSPSSASAHKCALRAARAQRSRRGDRVSLRECGAQGQLFASSTGPGRAREHRSQHTGSGKGTARESCSKPSIAPATRPAVPGWC